MTPGINRIKTWTLIAAMGGLFVLIGGAVGAFTSMGASTGALIFLGIGLVFNFAMYWYSDKIAIATTRSKPVTEQEQPVALQDRARARRGRADPDAQDLRVPDGRSPTPSRPVATRATRRSPSPPASCSSWTSASCAGCSLTSCPTWSTATS